jgi:hypothetical protein
MIAEALGAWESLLLWNLYPLVTKLFRVFNRLRNYGDGLAK